MEFTCEKKELQIGVSTVEKIVATRSTLPIIGYILFETGRNKIKLSANNLEMGIELEIKAQVSKEGSLLLPAKTLSGIVSKLPETEVGFKLNENKTVRVSYGKSHFNLNSLPPDEFPTLPKIKEGKVFNVKSDTVIAMIRQTIFAVSNSEDKYVLTGVLLEIGKSGLSGDSSNIRMIATDGYRLAKSGVKAGALGEGGVSAIIPSKVLVELLKILENRKEEEVKINISGEQICFRYGDGFIVSRLIQGQFPDYRQVIPKKSVTKVVMKTGEILEAAARAAVIASGSANVTCFEVKASKLHVSANTPDVGSVDEVVDAEIKGNEKVRASFNVRLITDVLNVIDDDEVEFEFGEGLSPGIIHPAEGEDYIYVVMPIRTQEAA